MLLRWFFGIFGPFGLALLLIFAFFFGLIFRILQGLGERFGPTALPLAAAPVWVGIEFFRSECWRLRFSWFGLGYSQHDNLTLLQLCSLGGVYLLSLLIAGSNGILAWAALRPSLRRGALCLCCAAVLAALRLGGQHLTSAAPADLAVIGVEGEMEPIAHYLERTTDALRAHPDTRLVIWPEYAMDYRLHEGHPYLGLVETMARKLGVSVLFGATRSAPGERPNNFENNLCLLVTLGLVLLGLRRRAPP